jgi:hypothetical protein
LVRKLALSLVVLALAAPSVAHAATASLRAATLSVALRTASERTRPFDLVGFHWHGAGNVRFSTRGLGGRWSAWRDAAPEDDVPDVATPERARQGSWRLGSPFWTGPSDGIRYRLSGEVTGLRAFFVRSTRPAVPPRTLAMASSPQIIPRAAWNADEEIRRAAPRYAASVRYALVHHTAGANAYTEAQSPAIVRAIELYHVQANGWNDIGYNFLVDKYGQIFEGRYGGMTRAVIGAHAEGFNTGSVGIAVIGSYSSTKIPPAAERAIEQLLAWRLDLAHVDPASTLTAVSGGNPKFAPGTPVTLRAISAHRDVYPTACPGQALYAALPAITAAVVQLGLPKIYAPRLTGTLGEPIRFTAKLSGSLPWTVTVTDANRVTLATGSGTGSAVDWTWDATAAVAGTYHWTIATPGARAATGALNGTPVPGGGGGGGGGTASATVSGLAPAPAIVTPNGDGVDDELDVTYALSAAAPVTVTILSGTAAIATAFSGTQAKGTQHVAWAPPPELPDGTYTVAVATGKSALSAPFTIDRTLASVAVTPALFSPNGDGRLDGTTLGYTLAQAATVDVRVEQAGALVADLGTQALSPGPQQLPWDGTGEGIRLGDGVYDLVVAATDPLTTVTQRAQVTVDTTPPLVTLLSLAKLRFRTTEDASVIATVNGKRIVLSVHAGPFRIPFAGKKPRKVVVVATDLAGNRSRFQRP